MAEHTKLSLSEVIDALKSELDRRPAILIATKSGRELSDVEKVEFFRQLEYQRQTQRELINPLLNQAASTLPLHQMPTGIDEARILYGRGGNIFPLNMQQSPPEGIMEHITQFGNWVEDTFLDLGLLENSAKTLAAIGSAYSTGASINNYNVTSSALPVIFQTVGKLFFNL